MTHCLSLFVISLFIIVYYYFYNLTPTLILLVQDYIAVRAPSKKSLNGGDCSDFDDEGEDLEFSEEGYSDNTSLVLDEVEAAPFPFTEGAQQHFHPV